MAKRILTKDQEVQFKEWAEDGNVSKIDDNKYLEQTTQWRKEFTLDELKAFFKREYLSETTYADGGVIFKDKKYDITYKVQKSTKRPNSWEVVENSPNWEQPNTLYFVTEQDATQYAKLQAGIITEQDPEEFFMNKTENFAGGGVPTKVVTFPDYDFKYYVLREDEQNYYVVNEEKIDHWKNANEIDRYHYYEEVLPKSDVIIFGFEKNIFADGGSIEAQNYAMTKSNNKAIMHHSQELSNVLKKNKVVPAWALALVYQSSQNLSNVTHYLEGAEKYAGGGAVGDVFKGTTNATYQENWQLFKPSLSYVIDNKTNKIVSIHNSPYEAIKERDKLNPNFKLHFKVYPKKHYTKFATGGVSKKVFGDNVTFLDRVGNIQIGMVQDMDDKGAEIFYEERFIKVPTNRIVKFH